MKIARVIDLYGRKYDLSFDGSATINTLREKLLNEYNYNTYGCYFCRSGNILNNESISKEIFTSDTINEPVIVFNSQAIPAKSYPIIDNSINFNFSRYSNHYINQNTNDHLPRFAGMESNNTYFPSPLEIASAYPFSSANLNEILNAQNNDLSESENVSEDENDDQNDTDHIIHDFSYARAILEEEASHNEWGLNDHDFRRTGLINMNDNFHYDSQDLSRIDPFELGYLIYQYLVRDNNLPQNENNVQNRPHIPRTRFSNTQRDEANLNQEIIESLNMNINLNEVDNQAISRLVQAGYDRTMVIQAYQLCNKNEEATLDLLISMG